MRISPAAASSLVALLLCACSEQNGVVSGSPAPGESADVPGEAAQAPGEPAAGAAAEEENRFLSEAHRNRAKYYWLEGDGTGSIDEPTEGARRSAAGREAGAPSGGNTGDTGR